MADPATDLRVLTAEIVSAFVARGQVRAEQLPELIRSVRSTLAEDPSTPLPVEPSAPARLSPKEIRRSITPNALISFVDGRPYKTLKRHLTTAGLTLAQYRQRYGLPDDYPSVAPIFSARRAEIARSFGLGIGNRRGLPEPVAAPEPESVMEPEPDPALAPALKAARGGRRKPKPDVAEPTPASAEPEPPEAAGEA